MSYVHHVTPAHNTPAALLFSTSTAGGWWAQIAACCRLTNLLAHGGASYGYEHYIGSVRSYWSQHLRSSLLQQVVQMCCNKYAGKHSWEQRNSKTFKKADTCHAINHLHKQETSLISRSCWCKPLSFADLCLRITAVAAGSGCRLSFGSQVTFCILRLPDHVFAITAAWTVLC